MTPFEDKVAVLVSLSEPYFDPELHHDYLDEFIRKNGLSIDIAFALEFDFVRVTDKGAELIDRAFQELLDTMGVEDTGWKSADDMVEVE